MVYYRLLSGTNDFALQVSMPPSVPSRRAANGSRPSHLSPSGREWRLVTVGDEHIKHENLQEKLNPYLAGKKHGFRFRISLKPTHWIKHPEMSSYKYEFVLKKILISFHIPDLKNHISATLLCAIHYSAGSTGFLHISLCYMFCVLPYSFYCMNFIIWYCIVLYCILFCTVYTYYIVLYYVILDCIIVYYIYISHYGVLYCIICHSITYCFYIVPFGKLT